MKLSGNLLIVGVLFAVVACSTNEEFDMRSEESTVDGNVGKIRSPVFDKEGCVVKIKNVSYSDIVKDEEKNTYYLPSGEEISLLDVMALIPGVKTCPSENE